jgi:hypothetical protein
MVAEGFHETVDWCFEPVRQTSFFSLPLVSELFGNSVQHSRSGVPGETVTVAVRAGDESSGWKSPIAAGLASRTCAPPIVARKAVGGWGWWRS